MAKIASIMPPNDKTFMKASRTVKLISTGMKQRTIFETFFDKNDCNGCNNPTAIPMVEVITANNVRTFKNTPNAG